MDSRVARLLAANRHGPRALRDLCRGCTQLLDIDGAGVSLLQPTGTELLAYGASDHTAVYLEELQFTVGEGPGRDAAVAERPVLVPDLAGPDAEERWPLFAPAAVEAGARAIFAFPVRLGRATLGVLDLFRTTPGPPAKGAVAVSRSVADLMVIPLLDLADEGGPGTAADDLDGPSEAVAAARIETPRAIGMISCDLAVDDGEALVRLRASAFARNLTAAELAHLVVSRRVRLDPDDG